MNPQERDSLVEVRCAVAIVRKDAILLLHREDVDDWVLPGGRPFDGESMGSCARREVREETALDINPTHCALVLEVNDPTAHRRLLELVFLADEFDRRTVISGEPGRVPTWVTWNALQHLALHPPIAGYLPSLADDRWKVARYLGNLWRPSEHSGDSIAGQG